MTMLRAKQGRAVCGFMALRLGRVLVVIGIKAGFSVLQKNGTKAGFDAFGMKAGFVALIGIKAGFDALSWIKVGFDTLIWTWAQGGHEERGGNAVRRRRR